MDDCVIRRLNGETLNIIDSCEKDGLFTDGRFKNDAEISDFIEDDLEVAILCAIIKCGDNNNYTLNIHSRDCYPALPLEGEIQLAKVQTEIYQPIIKYFIQYGFKDLFSSIPVGEE